MAVESPLVPSELSQLQPHELLLSETFTSIQGESTHAGRPCFFIRLAGCHLRCRWCDTAYAFHEGVVTTIEECLRRAADSGCRLVEVTGGEPLLQKPVYALLTELANAGYEVLLETSGAIPVDQVDPRVRRIVDWKLPASGESHRNQPSVVASLREGDELKLVVLDRSDYEHARDWLQSLRLARPEIGPAIPVLLSPVWGRLDPAELAAWILEDRLPARLNVQIHKVVFPSHARGV